MDIAVVVSFTVALVGRSADSSIAMANDETCLPFADVLYARFFFLSCSSVCVCEFERDAFSSSLNISF